MTNESTYYLPFIPQKDNLDLGTIGLNITHPDSGFKQYDTHSLMGHMQSMRSHEVLDKAFNDTDNYDKRPFMMSRSTFAGSGKYAHHWLGEKTRTWEDMKLTIAGIMNFNMFGIPMTGADVCGYYKSDLPEDE